MMFRGSRPTGGSPVFQRSKRVTRSFLLTITALALLAGGGVLHLSLAQNSVKKKAPRKASLEKVFPHSNKCKRCHFRAFEEWEASPLARSIHSAAFRVALEEYLTFSGNKDKALCFRCHAPHVNEFAELADHFVKQVRSRDPLIDGVGCAQCHFIREVDFTAHPPLPKYETGKTLFGPYADYVKNLAHDSMKLEIYRKSALCLNCHQSVPTAADLGKSNDLLGSWETSKAVKSGKECQTCHMPEQIGESANGEPKRRVANHTFPGRVGRLRQEGAKLDISAEVTGKTSKVTVTVRSLVPHNLPTTHPAWASVVLTLTIKGKNLKTVYQEDRVFGRVYADAKGRETVFDFKATKVLKNTVLKPEETRVETFTFPTPKDAPSMDVIASLRYAPISGPEQFLQRVEAESPRGARDPVFKAIDIAERSVNVLLERKR
ncbi:MAG: multiheme c-type cytochrome [Nitrospirales bacterium]